ncbi:hypothetical protein ACIBO2_45500 [Nonomuraea sp. NPDC050022]|uniref:hypothetical protein n=1 Tax=unclassified Nonomuraea TaxID=2593643 RepID=UPI0033F5A370
MQEARVLGAANGSSRLDELLVEAVTSAGSHIGTKCVLEESGQVLHMASEFGMPEQMARA